MSKKTTWADVNTDRVEERPFAVSGYTSRMGRSSTSITCPFCRGTFEAFFWSLHGSGKRCDCGALFGPRGTAYKLKEAL